MTRMILLNLAVFYALLGAVFFSMWLALFKQDNANLSEEERHLSWVVLAIATIFWPIVVPFAYRELLKTKRKPASEALPQPKIDGEMDGKPVGGSISPTTKDCPQL